jgi:hypothetical protein
MMANKVWNGSSSSGVLTGGHSISLCSGGSYGMSEACCGDHIPHYRNKVNWAACRKAAGGLSQSCEQLILAPLKDVAACSQVLM